MNGSIRKLGYAGWRRPQRSAVGHVIVGQFIVDVRWRRDRRCCWQVFDWTCWGLETDLIGGELLNEVHVVLSRGVKVHLRG